MESPSTASPGSLFRRDTSASYQEVPAEGGFDFGDDVSSSHLTEVVAQVEPDCPKFEDARVGFMFFVVAKSSLIHSTQSPTEPSFFSKFEPREYALRRSDGGHERC